MFAGQAIDRRVQAGGAVDPGDRLDECKRLVDDYPSRPVVQVGDELTGRSPAPRAQRVDGPPMGEHTQEHHERGDGEVDPFGVLPEEDEHLLGAVTGQLVVGRDPQRRAVHLLRVRGVHRCERRAVALDEPFDATPSRQGMRCRCAARAPGASSP